MPQYISFNAIYMSLRIKSQHVICHDINCIWFHNIFYAYNQSNLHIFVLVCKNIDIIKTLFNDNNINNKIVHDFLIFSPTIYNFLLYHNVHL